MVKQIEETSKAYPTLADALLGEIAVLEKKRKHTPITGDFRQHFSALTKF